MSYSGRPKRTVDDRNSDLASTPMNEIKYGIVHTVDMKMHNEMMIVLKGIKDMLRQNGHALADIYSQLKKLNKEEVKDEDRIKICCPEDYNIHITRTSFLEPGVDKLYY
jgi:hypothetical protein